MSENRRTVEDVEDYIENKEILSSLPHAEEVENFEESCQTCGCNLEEETEVEKGCHPHPHGVTCTRVPTQTADVSLPIRVKPYARMGTVETRCCGEPAMSLRHCCGPECTSGCDLLVTQTICCRIPIEYGVTATSGEATITCRRGTEAK